MHRIAVVMAGGSGERFWPLSRAKRPKQLLKLTHPDLNMLEEAVARIKPLVGAENVFVATSATLRDSISEAKVVPHGRLFAEPDRRNTLGALVWTTAQLMAMFPETWMTMSAAILTADHKIEDEDAFRETVSAALDLAEESKGLVTIGIRPTRPETGFGYIELGAQQPLIKGAYEAKTFKEKPDQVTAEEYVRSGQFLWNSGMFFWTLRAFYDGLTAVLPAAAEITTEIALALSAQDEAGALGVFRRLPNLSVDYALMEQADNVFVVESRFAWDDVGAWDALQRALPVSEHGNVLSGSHIVLDTKNSIVINDDGETITCVLGMEDVVVVTTKDAVLVCPKSRAQDVKKIVEELKLRGSKSL